jgi:hypothetical protein
LSTAKTTSNAVSFDESLNHLMNQYHIGAGPYSIAEAIRWACRGDVTQQPQLQPPLVAVKPPAQSQFSCSEIAQPQRREAARIDSSDEICGNFWIY